MSAKGKHGEGNEGHGKTVQRITKKKAGGEGQEGKGRSSPTSDCPCDATAHRLEMMLMYRSGSDLGVLSPNQYAAAQKGEREEPFSALRLTTTQHSHNDE
jgi:hypothetical protein